MNGVHDAIERARTDLRHPPWDERAAARVLAGVRHRERTRARAQRALGAALALTVAGGALAAGDLMKPRSRPVPTSPAAPRPVAWAGGPPLQLARDTDDGRDEAAQRAASPVDCMSLAILGSDTLPAERMRTAPAFEISTRNGERERARADAFAAAGFSRAIVNVQWQDVDPDSPHRLGERRDGKRGTLALLRDRGIRPVIMLDAFATLPRRPVAIELAAAAPRGARSLQLTASSASRVVPGRTLLENDRSFIEAVDDHGTAALSRALRDDLRAGPLPAAVVVYPPFPRPRLADGAPNPAFEEPMSGWLTFVSATMREARDVLRGDAFDVLVFNGARSPVLDADLYREDAPSSQPVDATTREILARTVAWLRDPRNGVERARIVDGFSGRQPPAVEKPFAPLAGLDARSRHLAVVRARGELFPESFLGTFASASGPEWAVTAFALWPDAPTGGPLSAGELRRTITRGALRALAAYVGSGASMFSFYEASPSNQIAVDGEPSGGETLRALASFLGPFAAAQPIGSARSLRLVAARDCTAAGAPVAFFPFQVASGVFVAPVYAATPDVAHARMPAEHDVLLDLDGIAGQDAEVSATDPVSGSWVDVAVLARRRTGMTVRMPLADYPRLLELHEP